MTICAGCKKDPSEIDEYLEMAELEDTTPEEFVVNNEGTYNSSSKQFYCTNCYIDAGMPIGIAP